MQPTRQFRVKHKEFGGALITVDEYDRPANVTDEQLTGQTVTLCTQFALTDTTKARIISAVADALSDAGITPADPPKAQCDAVFWWAKKHVTYTPEETLEAPFKMNLELDEQLDQAITPPDDLLAMPKPQGDCPDFSMLVAAMLRVLQIECAFKTIAADSTQPQAFSHIYTVALLPEGAYPLDASNAPAPGVEYSKPFKTKVWPAIHHKREAMKQQRGTLRGLGDFTGEGDSYSVDTTDTGSNDGGGNYTDLISNIADNVTKIAAPILKGRFSTPTVSSGTYYATRKDGSSVAYGQLPGSSPLNIGSGLGTGGNSSLLIYGGIAAVVLILLVKK